MIMTVKVVICVSCSKLPRTDNLAEPECNDNINSFFTHVHIRTYDVLHMRMWVVEFVGFVQHLSRPSSP